MSHNVNGNGRTDKVFCVFLVGGREMQNRGAGAILAEDAVEGAMPIVIVTGGGGALGKGICVALAARGWRVAVADIVEDYARETASALATRTASVKLLDVTRLADVMAVFAEVVSEQGGLDALVNCA